MSTTRLTERESQVLALIAEGLTNRQVAARLTVEQSTVRWYVRQIYGKLGAQDREHAVSLARGLGLLPEEVDSAPLLPTNLPLPVTPFVGRQREVQQLNALLGDETVGLVTIVGPGGIGKTRLALAAASNQLARRPPPGAERAQLYPDGVWFAPLVAVTHAEGLVAALAAALGLQLEGKGGREPAGQILHYLQRRRLLLVLDNFEQLAETAGYLATLVTVAPAVKILVTSRERLDLQAEYVFPIEGLALPQVTGEQALAINTFAAVQLFLNTARRVQPEFVLAAEDEPYLRQICHAVAGIPLALELAASWVSVLPVREIAIGIEESLELLAARTRDLPPRHHSIEAALAASWQRLSVVQQHAFLKLAIFRAGFTRHAAYAVAGAILPVLVQLVYKSWLVYDQKADRFRIHELLRQYALQRLAASAGSLEATRTAHTVYFLSFLRERAADFYGPRQLHAVQEIQAEIDDIWPAWQWAVLQQDAIQIDSGLQPLCDFFAWVGRWRDAESACRSAAAALAALDDEEMPFLLIINARVLLQQIGFTSRQEARRELIVRTRMLLGRAAAAGIDTRAERAGLHFQLGHDDTDVQTNIQEFEQAISLFRLLADKVGLLHAKLAQAHALARLGELDQAEAAASETLALCRELGDRRATAHANDVLAQIYKHKSMAGKAEHLQRESIALYQSLHALASEMEVTCNLANTLWSLGRLDEMLELVERAITMQENLGLDPVPYLSWTRARALLHLGRYSEARRVAETVLADAQVTAYDFRAHLQLDRAQLAVVDGTVDSDDSWLAEGVAALQRFWPSEAAEFLATRAYLHLREGDRQCARLWLRRALRSATASHSYNSCHFALPAAALLLAPSQPERAVELHALSQTYPLIASSRWFADVAGRRLEEIAALLPPAVAAAARARGQTLDLWQIAAALRTELAERSL
jgi:predicted ATPase/DNA-binding CsgD family transcriptional regulator